MSLDWHALDAKRLAVVLAFAGGSLYGAAVISFWRGGAGNAPLQHGSSDRRAHATAPSTTSTGSEEPSDNALATERLDQPETVSPVERARTTASAEPSSAKASAELDGGGTAETGSSVGDVLARLEAEYRQGLVAAARTNARASVAPDVTNPVTPTPAAEPAAREDAPVAAAPAPAKAAPEVAPKPAAEPAPQPVEAPRPEPEPVVVRIDPTPAAIPTPATNVSIGTLHQGDVYQVQQLAVLQQYYQLLGVSPYAAYAAPPAPPPQTTHHHSTIPAPSLPQAAPPFPSFLTSLTNPDNPWGYHYAHPRSGR